MSDLLNLSTLIRNVAKLSLNSEGNISKGRKKAGAPLEYCFWTIKRDQR